MLCSEKFAFKLIINYFGSVAQIKSKEIQLQLLHTELNWKLLIDPWLAFLRDRGWYCNRPLARLSKCVWYQIVWWCGMSHVYSYSTTLAPASAPAPAIKPNLFENVWIAPLRCSTRLRGIEKQTWILFSCFPLCKIFDGV